MKTLGLLIVAYGSLFGPEARDYDNGRGQWTQEQRYQYEQDRRDYLQAQELQERLDNLEYEIDRGRWDNE